MGKSPTLSGFDRLETRIHRLSSVLVAFGGLCLLAACGLTLASVIGSVALRGGGRFGQQSTDPPQRG